MNIDDAGWRRSAPIGLASGLIVACMVGAWIVGVPDGPDTTFSQFASRTSAESAIVTDAEFFRLYLADYKADLRLFEDNLWYQGVLVVVALLVLFARKDVVEFAGASVPVSWLRLIGPFLLLTLWLNFGFLLHDLIRTRLELLGLLHVTESGIHIRRLLFDAGFIDGWFVCFVDTINEPISGIDASVFGPNAALFLFLVLGSYIAAAHASLLTLADVGVKLALRPARCRWLWRTIVVFLLTGLVCASHLNFLFGERGNPNWIQVYIGLATIALLFGLSALLRRLHETGEKSG